MSNLNDLRTEAKALLETVAKTYESIPETLTAPCLFLVPSDPFVERLEGRTTFNEYRATFDVVLVVKAGTNSVMHKAMDDLVNECLNALNNPASENVWNIGPVEKPGVEAINGTNHYTASFTISNTFKGGSN